MQIGIKAVDKQVLELKFHTAGIKLGAEDK